ncbi:hypothetical protein [Azospirillum soli]|uniref:hypothetical protein n=1 Tax=Azospirillum soli TaxID=1304799 RepID=UPI001AE482AC|nr:hypothetical protein [Azospirillum soli]MBP2312987.1 hypothetical protein [Azospirillum soli]
MKEPKGSRYKEAVLHRSQIRLSPTDRETLRRIRTRYEDERGVNPSNSIILSMALSSLSEEMNKGILRGHPSLT